MERFGFIHEKLDIKILILYILRRLPEAVDAETLSQLTLFDVGIGYFDYTDCLSELVDTGHVAQENGRYRITEKGERNGAVIENSLPYSVRAKADSLLTPVAAGMRRSAMITATHETDGRGSVQVHLSLSDGVGEILAMKLLVAGEEQAKTMEQNFRQRAEGFYQEIVASLSD